MANQGQEQEAQPKKKQRIFTIKDSVGSDIIFDLEQIFMIILPSYLALKPEQRHANVAAIFVPGIKMDLNYDQVSRVRAAWFEYFDIEKPSPFEQSKILQ